MIENDDWRLFNEVSHLHKQSINPVDGDSIMQKLPELSQCIFCWDTVEKGKNDHWYLPLDNSCCICEGCFQDFKELYQLKLLDGWDLEL